MLIARSRPRPVTADEVGAALGIHRSVARGRLERLVQAGLLTPEFERRTGRSGPGAGRPAKIYRVPPETAALEFPERHYDRLLGRLVDTIDAADRSEALARVGAGFAHDLVAGEAPADPSAAAERACAALGQLGFQATIEEVANGRVTISTPTCPLRPLVIANPEAAAIDRGLWAELVGAVGCETCDCLDGHASCKVVLEFDRD